MLQVTEGCPTAPKEDSRGYQSYMSFGLPSIFEINESVKGVNTTFQWYDRLMGVNPYLRNMAAVAE